jgi:hypothetical protein
MWYRFADAGLILLELILLIWIGGMLSKRNADMVDGAASADRSGF